MAKSLKAMFDKIKKVKHIELIIALLFVVILLAIYFSSFKTKSTEKSVTQTSTTASQYSLEVESKLENVLSKIDGAGSVSVMVMLEEQTELQTTILPKVNSVIVVAEGAKNANVKIQLYQAVEALLELPANSIQVLVGKK